MKKVVIYLLSLVVFACADTQMNHTETAKLVVESFYTKDNSKLKSYTTSESYESFMAVQDFMTSESPGKSNFEVIDEIIDGDTAWVKFTTSYEEKPETFKLLKVNGVWKVAEKGLREKSLLN